MSALQVLLVNPSKLYYPLPPLSLAYLATYARTKGRPSQFAFTVCDENAGEDAMHLLRRKRFDVVALTSVTVQIPRAYTLATAARAAGCRCVILGGAHATALPNRTLAECPSLDAVLVGEGERAFLAFLEAVAGGADVLRDGAAFDAIPSLVVRGGRTPDRAGFHDFRLAGIEDLDHVPIPDRRLFNLRYYRRPRLGIRGLVGRATHLMASRGCPYDCSFCGSKTIWGRRVRAASPERVLEEVGQIAELGFGDVFFQDDIFSLQKDRAVEICNGLLRRGLARKVRWTVQMRPNLVSDGDRDLLCLMKRAGCVQVEYGFESGSERMLKLLKTSAATVERNSEVIRITRDAGLRVLGTFILGTEGETDDDVLATRRFIERHQEALDYYQVFLSTPYPGTKLWTLCEDAGLLEGKSWDQFAMGVFDHTVFSTTVDARLVLDTQRDLTNASFRKVSFTNKLLWLASRLRDDPRYVLRRVREMF